MSFFEQVKVAEDESRIQTGYTPPKTYSLTNGTLTSGTLENVSQRDLAYMTFAEDASSGLDIIFDFQIPKNEKARRLELFGRYSGGADHYLDVYLWDWSNNTWKEISTLNNKDIHNSDVDQHLFWDFDLPAATDANGNIRVRFEHSSGVYDSSHYFKIDKLGTSDYKSAQILADVYDINKRMTDLIANEYITLPIDGSTTYDLGDPRVKGANPSQICVYADLTNDSDFKAVRIPVVDTFSDLASPGSWRFDSSSSVIEKISKSPVVDKTYTGSITYRRNRIMVPIDNNKIAEIVFFMPFANGTTWEYYWRILPENFTITDHRTIPFTKNVVNNPSFININLLSKEGAVHNVSAAYTNGMIVMQADCDELSGTSRLSWVINFNSTSGFDGFREFTTVSFKLSGTHKGAAVCQTKSDRVVFTQLLLTSQVRLYSVGETLSNLVTVTFTNPYEDYKGLCLVPYYNGGGNDVLLFVGTAMGFDIYHVDMDAGSYSLIHSEATATDSSVDSNISGMSMPNGEVVFAFKSFSNTSVYSTSFGDSGTYISPGLSSLYLNDGFVVSTDKIYVPEQHANGRDQGEEAEYLISPMDLTTILEARIDYEAIAIEFSKPPVKGTNAYVSEYTARPALVDNQVTVDKDGVHVVKPLAAKLIDVSGIDAIGEVQDVPTTNTLLGRVKSIVDGLSKFVFDSITGRLSIIGHLHSEIHDGGMWYIDHEFTTGLTGVASEFLLTGHPTLDTHISFGFGTDSKVWARVFKISGATPGTDITATTLHNAKHSITTPPGATLTSAPTGGTTSHLMHWSFLDKENINHDKEHILEPGEQILIRVIPDKDNITAYLTASFYEE